MTIFKKVATNTKYFNFKELSPDTLLVDGFYVGEVEGEYGVQHEWKDLEGQIYVFGGGHLDWLVNKHLVPGSRCRVFFAGMDTLEKGRFKNKPVKKFELELAEEDVAEVKVEAPAEKPRKRVLKKKAEEPVVEDGGPEVDGDSMFTEGL